MKIAALVFLSMLTGYAQDQQDHKVRNWNFSVAFLVGTHAMDTMSSRGLMERNPVLGAGQFGTRQMVIKGSITSGVILAERLILRKHPETRRFWMWANYATGTAIAAIAVRNWNQPAPFQPGMTIPVAK